MNVDMPRKTNPGMTPATRLGRRHLCAIGACIVPLVLSRHAGAATGILALDMPADRLIRPAAVVLIAIANAGSRLIAVGEHGVIVFSDDFGISWSQADVPVDVTLTCVQFATPLCGWVAGHFGVILTTADGGATWRLQLNGLQANKLTMQSAQLATAQKSTAPGGPLALRRADNFVQDGPDKPFLSLAVLSPQNIIAFGAFRMTMITTDGGATWQDWSLHIGDPLSHNLYAAKVIGSYIYLVGEAGMIFCSTDGGKEFPRLASPSAVTLFGIIGAADDSLVAFGVAGNVFRSGDGGKSWSSVAMTTQAGLTAARLTKSGAILMASEAGEMFVSRNNGKSFATVAGLPQTAIFDFIISGGELVIVGNTGASRATPPGLNL